MKYISLLKWEKEWLQAVSVKGTKSTSVATNFYQSKDFYQNQKWSEVSRNMFAGVVHQEGAEGPAVRQVEEEDINGAVLGVQVEEPQEVGLEAGGLADLEVVEVVVEAGLAVVENVEVGVSEGHSSAACKNLFL